MSSLRFFKEYANFKKRKLQADIDLAWTQTQIDIYKKGIETIDWVVSASRKGLITLDEAMKMIAEA